MALYAQAQSVTRAGCINQADRPAATGSAASASAPARGGSVGPGPGPAAPGPGGGPGGSVFLKPCFMTMYILRKSESDGLLGVCCH